MSALKKQLTAIVIAGIMILRIIPAFAAATNITGINGWSIALNNGCQGTAEIDTTVSNSGSASLKLIDSTPKTPDVYMMATAGVTVEAGKRYKYGASVKSVNTQNLYLMINWDARTSLIPFGNTFDFTKYEFLYVPEKTDNVSMNFLIDGVTDGIWLDDVFFIDMETGENLVKNPDFEDVSETKEDTAIAAGEVQLAQAVLAGEEYAVSDAEKAASMFKHLPAFYRDITVDANGADWSFTTLTHMPVDASQHQIYYDNENALDVTVDYAFAHNDEYLFMYFDVHDDNHKTYDSLAQYWQGDSIQLALSEKGETFGYEIGLIHEAVSNAGKIYSSDISERDLANCKLATARTGNHTIYEAAFPWTMKYGNKRDNILINFIVNDNDSGERRYCVRLAKGIAETKSNAEYPTLEMLPEGQEWYAWIEGTKNPGLDVTENYGVLISNSGDTKSFVVKDPETGESENISLKRGEGRRVGFTRHYMEEGDTTIKTELEVDGENYVLTNDVKVIMPYPTQASATAMRKAVEAYAEELAGLLAECKSRGITTDYEDMYYMTITRFAQYMQADIDHSDYERINFTKKSVDSIYKTAKESLEKYLSGEKEPLDVPRFVTGKIDIDGSAVWAETMVNGIKEYRPVIFNGYGHFEQAKKEVDNFRQWGLNTIQNEIGSNRVLVGAAGVKVIDWSWIESGVIEAEAEVQTDVSHSGDRALKIRNASPKKSNVYASLTQDVNVKANTEYNASVWIKGKNVSGAWIGFNDYDQRLSLADANDEWQNVTFSFTTGENEFVRRIRIASEDITDELYIDDLTCTSADGDEIMFNGDFEKFIPEGADYIVSDAGMVPTIELLERCEKYNTSVNLLISPQYLSRVSGIMEKYPELSVKGGGFFLHDVNNPIAREMTEVYLRELIPKIKDYKSLDSFCLTNEPAFRANQNQELYNERWHEYLKYTHGTIENLNEKYGAQYKSFDEIEMPEDIIAAPESYDYKNFNDLMLADFHIWLADLIKELAPDIPLHVKIMPYVASADVANNRQNFANGTAFEYFADHVDMDGNDAWNYLEDNQGELIKTMWYDFLHSIKDAPVVNSEDHLMYDRSNNYYDDMDKYVSADIWQGGIHHRACTEIWIWERGYERSADNWGLMLYRPNSVAGISKAGMDLMRLSYPVYSILKETTDVGILYSDTTRVYDTTNMNLVYETYAALMRSGKKTEFVTEHQTEKINNYKMIIVPRLTHVQEKTVDAVVSYINNGGKVLLLGDDCFAKTEYNRERNRGKTDYIYAHSTVYSDAASTGSELIDMTSYGFLKRIQQYLSENGCLYVRLVDASTGEPAQKIEYTPAIYNEKLVINICNYGDTGSFRIEMDGKPVKESTELRSMEKFGEEFTCEQYMPIMVEIDVDNCFMDTYGHWAKNNITELYNKGLVNGVTNSRFSPDEAVTYAEFITMVIRASEIKQEPAADDTRPWYEGYMAKAYKKGYLSQANIDPNAPIKREDMCDILVKAYEGREGIKAGHVEVPFKDAGSITNIDAVSKAYSLGFVNGKNDGWFDPVGNLTRAEAAVVILKYFNS